MHWHGRCAHFVGVVVVMVLLLQVAISELRFVSCHLSLPGCRAYSRQPGNQCIVLNSPSLLMRTLFGFRRFLRRGRRGLRMSHSPLLGLSGRTSRLRRGSLRFSRLRRSSLVLSSFVLSRVCCRCLVLRFVLARCLVRRSLVLAGL